MRGLFLGMATVDVIHYVRGTFGNNEKAAAEETRIHAGGPAANAAVTYSLLGGDARLVTFAGSGALTACIEQELSSYGVVVDNCSAGEDQNPVTASVIVHIETGDRTVVGVKPRTEPHAASFYEPDILPDVLLFDTYFTATAAPYLSWAMDKRIPTVLDGGSWKRGLETVLPYITYALCSEHFLPPGCTTHDETVEYLKGFGIPAVCITRGERPILLYPPGGSLEEIPVKSPGQVQDTLGAGDIFHGAFCYFIAQGSDFRSAVTASSRIASQSVCFRGPRTFLLK